MQKCVILRVRISDKYIGIMSEKYDSSNVFRKTLTLSCGEWYTIRTIHIICVEGYK